MFLIWAKVLRNGLAKILSVSDSKLLSIGDAKIRLGDSILWIAIIWATFTVSNSR